MSMLWAAPGVSQIKRTNYWDFEQTVFGDLADMAGRRPAYILSFTVYLAANIGLALQDSYAGLFMLRCLQSTGSSGAIALGYGVVADVSTSSERGKYIGTHAIFCEGNSRAAAVSKACINNGS